MIKCAIIDDEQHAIDVLTFNVSQFQKLNLLGSFTDPLTALNFLNDNHIDLLFLDIQMPGISGIEFIKALQHKNMKIIICSAYSEFAYEGFELNVVDYLLKPIGLPRFLKAVQKVADLINADSSKYLLGEQKENYFFIKKEQKGKLQRINFDEIDYIESRRNYVAIYCNNQYSMVLATMKEMEEKLPSNKFLRIHKSIIVALDKIIGLHSNYIVLNNCKAPLPIGENYKETLRQIVNSKTL